MAISQRQANKLHPSSLRSIIHAQMTDWEFILFCSFVESTNSSSCSDDESEIEDRVEELMDEGMDEEEARELAEEGY